MAYRSNAQATGTTSATVTKPTGTVDDDIMIAGVGSAAGGVIAAPAGWTQLGTEQVLSGNRTAFFWKRAASEGASYAFTSAAAVQTVAEIASFSGRITTGDPTDGVTTSTSASGTSHTVAGFTTTDTDDFVNIAATLVAAVTYTAPTNFTERLDANNSCIDTWDAVTAGATGNITTTSSGTTRCGQLFVALKPAGGVVDTQSSRRLMVGIGS